jgi:hypothetical protein
MLGRNEELIYYSSRIVTMSVDSLFDEGEFSFDVDEEHSGICI